MMDEIDRKLLGLLQADATLSMAQLADAVGLSATPVWKRVQKMEGAGVITGRVALLAPAPVGIGLIVYVAIEAPEHSAEWMGRYGGHAGGHGGAPHGRGGRLHAPRCRGGHGCL